MREAEERAKDRLHTDAFYFDDVPPEAHLFSVRDGANGRGYAFTAHGEVELLGDYQPSDQTVLLLGMHARWVRAFGGVELAQAVREVWVWKSLAALGWLAFAGTLIAWSGKC